MTRTLTLVVLLALAPLADAAAQITYGQCQDRARDRLMRNQVNPAIGRDRALEAYTADIAQCQRIDSGNRARDAQIEQQRFDQRQDQQRFDQQRLDQQRLAEQRARQRDDMYRNRR